MVVREVDVLLTMDPSAGDGEWGRIDRGAVAFEGDRVCWVGRDEDAPEAPRVQSGRGCVGLPALVDCHTHSVWAGSRATEFEQRLAGANYSDILEAGGGILSTVRASRAASEPDLVGLCVSRLQRMAARGVGTVEIKSGYGLSPAAELKLLRVAAVAGRAAGVRVIRTFLGAHSIPLEFRSDRAGYLQQILEEQLPLVVAEADCVDVYVDRGAFTVDEGRAILQAGQSHGLHARIHAEQVTHTGAAEMAASLGALSADHLERIDADGIAAMAEAGTVGVMLPGAMLYLGDPPPPVDALREAGVPLAVATDLNPGSSPVDDLWSCATLACIGMGLTVEESLRGITCVGADALGRPDLGRLQVGAPGAMVLARPRPGEPIEPASLVQFLGGPAVEMVRG